MNTDIALEHVDGDREFLAELVEMFIEDYPRLIQEAKDAFMKNDPEGFERTMHTLQGRLAFFGVQKEHEKALKLEEMGREKNLAGAGESLPEVEADMKTVMCEFESLIREQKK